jgi:hypothetical protein
MFDALVQEYNFLCSSSMGGFSSHLMIFKQVIYLPGLPLSLLVGMNYGKHLSCKSGKPLIPIHHMEAHALTIRMVQKVWDSINNFHTVNKMCSPDMQGDCVICEI